MSPGGLWETSQLLYTEFGAKFRGQPHLDCTFPSGYRIYFKNLQYEKDLADWQGSQVPVILFDELTHFTKHQFFYMLSRNRSVNCGFRPYVRGTCNPDPDSWVALFIQWWINQDTGYPIYERSGLIRWLLHENNEFLWGNTREQVIEQSRNPKEADPKTVTFIPGNVYDNKILVENDPAYVSNLKAQNDVEQARLLGGNWKIRPTRGSIFNRYWYEIISPESVPLGGIAVRFWDFAATVPKMRGVDTTLENSEDHGPAYTAGVLMKYVNNQFYILDLVAERKGPADIDEIFRLTAISDFKRMLAQSTMYLVRWEEEGGASGIRDSYRLATMIQGIDCAGIRPEGDKLVRARPFASQSKIGNVKLVEGAWNEQWLSHMHNQPEIKKKDIMDATSGSFTACLTEQPFITAY
jgi:predicted phage terminase large subunit-like protein